MNIEKEVELPERVLAASLQEAVSRATSLSWAFAIIFLVYGFTSIDFIRKFSPELSLWNNLWPRFLFSFVPFVLLGIYVKTSKVSNQKKLIIWITGFALTLHATAWIHIWPIALHRSAGILPYVHGANLYLYATVFAVVAPPARYLAAFFSILVGIFVIPFFVVSYYAGDAVIFKVILNDSTIVLISCIAMGLAADRLRTQLLTLKLEKEIEASKFLGPVLSKAIFENQKQRLTRVRCRGFVISMDIRDSTGLQQKFGERWLAFRREYFELVSKLVQAHGGYTQKTVGDCHVINFGVMDYGADLSDIPGIETELERADDRRLQRASDAAFGFLDSLFPAFSELVQKHFSGISIHLGAGIDKGWIERGIQGDTSHAELDVNGDPVNCSNRLQDYSKVILAERGWESSVLVVSPFASDYLKNLSSFVKIQTTDKPIRNYPTLKWVLAKPCGPLAHETALKKAA